MRNIAISLLLGLAAFQLLGCVELPIGVKAGEPTVRIVTPGNPVRMEPTKHAPVIGIVFGGMEFPAVAKAEFCEFLQVRTPWWGDVWVIGPPEFATFESGGCADLPDRSLYLQPKG